MLYPLTQMDPRDALPHAQSTIVLYTKLDAECESTGDSDQLTRHGRVVNNRPSTVACLSHLSTDVPEFGIKLQRKVP